MTSYDGSGPTTVTVNDIEIAFERSGEGPTVVFVGGIDMDLRFWRQAYTRQFHKGGYSTLTVNLRGVPPSTITEPPYSVGVFVDDCQALLSTLNVDHCFLVGASLGAFVVQELALRYPERKAGLALIATVAQQSAWVRSLTRAEVALYASETPIPADYLIACDLLQMLTKDELLNDELTSRVAAKLQSRNHSSKGRRGLLSAASSYDGCLDRIAGLKIPALFISFAEDVLTPAASAREAACLAPDGHFLQYDAIGHSGIQSCSQRIGSEIVRFFDQLRPVTQ